MITFIQNYFKAGYFQADHLRVSSGGVPPQPTEETRPKGAGKRRWYFTLPSGRSVIVTDPRIIKALVEAEELDQLLESLSEPILSDPVVAGQRTVADAITALLLRYAEAIYETTEEMLEQENLRLIAEQQKAAEEDYLAKQAEKQEVLAYGREYQFQADELSRQEAALEREVRKARAIQQAKEDTLQAEVDAALDAWLEECQRKQKEYDASVEQAKAVIARKVKQLEELTTLSRLLSKGKADEPTLA